MHQKRIWSMSCLMVTVIVGSMMCFPFLTNENLISTAVVDSERVLHLSELGAPQLEWNFTAGGSIYGSLCLADVDEDEGLEILFGASDRKLYCLNSTGCVKWTYTTTGSVDSTPSVADVDNDGMLEVIVTSDKLYCINADGGFEWSYTTGGLIFSSPCVANLDLDPILEILIGSDRFYCIDGNGDIEWSNSIYPTYASACVADIYDWSTTPEILIGELEGPFYCLDSSGGVLWSRGNAGTGSIPSACSISNIDVQGSSEILVASYDPALYCLNSNGSTRWTYEDMYDYRCSTPTVAELSDAEGLETIVCSWNRVYCINSTGSLEWEYVMDGITRTSQCVVDIDGESELEILLGTATSGTSPGLLCLTASGNKEWQYNTSYSVDSAPCAADIDKDSVIEVLFCFENAPIDKGVICCVSVVGAPMQPASYCWPSIGFMGDIRRTGCFEDNDSDILTNDYEITAGCSPSHADTDTDDKSDFEEFLKSTDPTLDSVPPKTVGDLSVVSSTSDTITLSWTAPGDNNGSGIAHDYILRYSVEGPIDTENYNEAIVYDDDWTPQLGGVTETRIVTGLSAGTTYWFALVATDEVPNSNDVSNSPQGTTTAAYHPLLIPALAGVLIGILAVIVVLMLKRR